jgi:hypothetical protein
MSNYYLYKPVASYASLPVTGNYVGRGCVTIDTNKVYIWNGTTWQYLVTLLYESTNIVLKFCSGVETVGDLPMSGNVQGDARIVNATGDLWVWDGSDWMNQGQVVDLDWDLIEGRPSSSVADIDNAVAQKHAHIEDEIPTQLNLTTFQTAFNYQSGSLEVTLNGLEEEYITEVSPNTFAFEIDILSGDIIQVEYIKA